MKKIKLYILIAFLIILSGLLLNNVKQIIIKMQGTDILTYENA